MVDFALRLVDMTDMLHTGIISMHTASDAVRQRCIGYHRLDTIPVRLVLEPLKGNDQGRSIEKAAGIITDIKTCKEVLCMVILLFMK